MIWLSWRLQRTEFGLLALLLALLLGSLALSHDDVAGMAGADGCLFGSVKRVEITSGPVSQDCSYVPGVLYRLVKVGLPWFNFLPLIAAILMAMPLISELESGTYRLVWTQGITRRHWESVKLGVLMLSCIVFAGLFSLTFNWWSGPADAIVGRLGQVSYDFRGTLPIAHTVFAVSLVLLIGTMLRRQIPTIALAAVGYVVTRLLFTEMIRPRLVTPITANQADYSKVVESGVWETAHYWQDATGAHVSEQQVERLCPPIRIAGVADLRECVASHGLTEYFRYHPASHYWALQLRESGIYLGASAVLIGLSAWLVLRRIE
jgi:hypothetical protein